MKSYYLSLSLVTIFLACGAHAIEIITRLKLAQDVTPKVTALNDGGYFVAWGNQVSPGYSGEFEGLSGQRFYSNSSRYGPQLQITNSTFIFDPTPSVTSMKDGGFMVAYQETQRNYSTRIYARRFNSKSEHLGPQIDLNHRSQYLPKYTGLSSLEDGGFVVVWGDKNGDIERDEIYGQLYTKESKRASVPFVVSSDRQFPKYETRISALKDGGYIVVWTSQQQDGSNDGIFAQRYHANSSRFGTEFQVNTYWSAQQQSPAVAALEDGGYVVVYFSYQQPNIRISGQRYHANQSKYGDEFMVTQENQKSPRWPAVAGLKDGGYVVVWFGIGRGSTNQTIIGQRYHANQTKFGKEFEIFSYSSCGDYEFMYPDVAGLEDGGYFVVWNFPIKCGYHNAVLGQRYNANQTLFDLESEQQSLGLKEVASPPTSLEKPLIDTTVLVGLFVMLTLGVGYFLLKKYQKKYKQIEQQNSNVEESYSKA